MPDLSDSGAMSGDRIQSSCLFTYPQSQNQPKPFEEVKQAEEVKFFSTFIGDDTVQEESPKICKSDVF